MRKLIGKVLTRRDTSANWTKNNPILGKGECGYATDLRRTKHGDGTTRWNSLPWDDAATTNGHTVNSDVPEGAKFTDTTYTAATTSANGLMSAADKSKLDGIGTGSNVKSVNGKTGAVTLAKSDVGLGNVDNTKDADKPISTAVQTALDAKANNSVATESTDGLMSAADKTKLDGIDPSAIATNAANIKKNADDLGAVSKIINDHAANKSNPHGVTKAQVGLGSVANLDQSKAIKSITRSGTTFTATALDGTTSTFTQQDSNTTYSVATSSADGLMSAADKSKLDGIGAGSVSQPTFAGTKATISAAYTPAGTVTVTPDVQLNTTPIAPMDSAGTLPSFTTTVTNKKLILGWDAGTLATKGAAVTVATSIKSQTASATFTGTSGTAVADYTPTGTVSKPTFNCNSKIIE